MTTLAALIAQLQSEVPAVNSVPTVAQYTQAIKDAVLDFSRRCGLIKNTTISVVSGTPTYNLPADFLSLISFDSLYDPQNRVIITTTGIIPFNATDPFEEKITIANKVMTIYPTPAYSMDRFMEYKAGWVLTGSNPNETYATMGDDEAQIIMIKAKGLAIEKQADKLAASGGMKYSLGAVSVDKGAGTESLTSKVYKLHGEFVEACETYNGAVGSFG